MDSPDPPPDSTKEITSSDSKGINNVTSSDVKARKDIKVGEIKPEYTTINHEIKSENDDEINKETVKHESDVVSDDDNSATDSGAADSSSSAKEPVTSSQNGGKMCVVCGDKALSCNFGAITCESCKAFFRRNAFKDFSAKCDKTCDVTVETRSYCKRCRLNKCLSAGMKVQLILSDDQKRRRKQKIFENKLRRMGQGGGDKGAYPMGAVSEQDCYIGQDNIPQPYLPMPVIPHANMGAVPHSMYTHVDIAPTALAQPGADTHIGQHSVNAHLMQRNADAHLAHLPVRSGSYSPDSQAPVRLPGIEHIATTTEDNTLAPSMAAKPSQYQTSELGAGYIDVAHKQSTESYIEEDYKDMPPLTVAPTHSSFEAMAGEVAKIPLSYRQAVPGHPGPNTRAEAGSSSTVYLEHRGSGKTLANQSVIGQYGTQYSESSVSQSRFTSKRTHRDSSGEVHHASESSPSERSTSPWGSMSDNQSDHESPKPSSADISQGGLLATTMKVIRDAKMFQTKISDLPPPICKPLFTAAFDDPVLKVDIPSFTEVASQLRNACLAAYDKLPPSACPSNPSYVQMFNFGEDTIRQLVILAKNLPPFQALCRDDQICLLKASVLHMMVLKSSMSYDPEIRGWRVIDSEGERNVIPNAVRASQDGRVLMNHYGIITISVLVASRRDMVVIALLIVLSLLSDNNVKDPNELKERHKVNAAYTLYVEFMRSYVLLKYPEKTTMFQDLLNSLDIVKDFSDTYINAMLKSPLSQLNPLLLEINDIMST